MKTISLRIITSLGLIGVIAFSVSCLGEGEEGESGVDCGDHGTEHDGHCHCDDGYLWNGETCVTPDQITEICEEHEENGDTEDDHDHVACVCPDEGDCPCDDGSIVTIGGQDYCEPEPQEE